MGVAEVGQFLDYLAVEQKVTASTQSQALAALLFLYREVLERPLEHVQHMRASPGKRLRIALTRDEVQRVLREMDGVAQLVARLLYGGGLRLMEAVQLRVQDLDFAGMTILVRAGKGNKDRRTILSEKAEGPLREHLAWVRERWERNRSASRPVRTPLPHALSRKYPNAEGELGWQWVFPAARTFYLQDAWWRWHLHESAIQRAVKDAVRKSGVNPQASSHTFRHSFATHLLQDGYDVRTVQELMGHASLATTQTYLHVLNRALGVRSPADKLDL
jgi:integron integrase